MEKSELEEKIRDPQERIDSLKKEILKDSKRLNEIFTLISLPDVEYYNRFMIDDFRLAKEEIEFGSEEHLRVGAEKGKLISEYSKLEDDLPFKKVRLTRANAATKPPEKEKVQYKKKLEEVIQKIKEKKNKIQELSESEFQMPEYPIPEKIIDRRKPGWQEQKNLPEKIDSGLSLTGADVMKMKFHPFQLPSDLGRFLGKIERSKLAIAVTGESNTGKSYFSFEMGKLFIENRFSVIYFSLEEGISEITKEKINLYDLGTTAFEIRDKGSCLDRD